MAKPVNIQKERIHGQRFPQRILANARTFINVVQHLRDFGLFEMNKPHLGRQRDRILVAEVAVCSLAVGSKRCSGNS
jgi:hypothetical protein